MFYNINSCKFITCFMPDYLCLPKSSIGQSEEVNTEAIL